MMYKYLSIASASGEVWTKGEVRTNYSITELKVLELKKINKII